MPVYKVYYCSIRVFLQALRENVVVVIPSTIRDKEVITGNENNYLAHKLLLITYLTLCTCAKQIMINLVIISKSNSNESLSQIKAEASMLIVVFYLLNG